MSVVGIDLGTTNTVVACVRAGKVDVLADERGVRLLPSVVSFHPNGDVLVGSAAKARRIIDPRNTVYSHKRLLGRSWGSAEITQARERFAFELREGPGQGPVLQARGRDYTLPEISAFVLKRARQVAETALGSPVERAVITVPAHFNELQRASTKVAGRVSGLEVLRILNEPTAAALAYGLGRKGNERVAVYDFGGGTFDCTLLDLDGNVFEVLATAGDSFLGGDDVDSLIADRMAEMVLKTYRQDPRTDPTMLERLRTAAEDVKIALSTVETHTVVLKELGHGAGGSSNDFTFTLSRGELDAMITPLVEKSFKVTQDALALARLSPTAFDKVILVGGSTQAPLIRKRVADFFGQAPMDRVNPDEVVAIGAAIQAAALTEGQRKRPIPAPPSVRQKPRTMPGSSDRGKPTETDLQAPAQPTFEGGSFGTVEDLSLVPSTEPLPAPDFPPTPNAFGHASDLSLISTDAADAITDARARALVASGFDDEEAQTEVQTQTARSRTLTFGPTGNRAAHEDDLPALAGDNVALPAVVSRSRSKPVSTHPGESPTGDSPMLGKPPPLRAPQPFGPMGPIAEHDSPLSHTAGMHAQPIPAGSAPPLQRTLGARVATAPLPAPRTSTTPTTQPPKYDTAPMPAPFAPPRYEPSSPHQPSQPPPPGQFPQVSRGRRTSSMPPPLFGFPSAPPAVGHEPIAALEAAPLFDDGQMGQQLGPRVHYQSPVLVDVTPRGLVVETAGGYSDTIIPRNSKIPCERTRRFATGRDNQTTVRVRVGQGEVAVFPENTFLGEVELSGLRAAPRGEVVVAVTFEVDVDGTLRLRARDVATGQEARATIQLIGVADESSVVMMINRFAQQPVSGEQQQ